MTSAPFSPRAGLQLEDAPCDYCTAMEADVLLTAKDRVCGLPGSFNVVVCRECGLARTNPRPTSESLAAAYPEDYEAHQGGLAWARPPRGFLRWALLNYRNYPLGRRAPAALRWLLWPWAAWFLRRRRYVGYVPWGGEGRLLDFGCGSGRYVAQMAAAGWDAEGMDLVPRAVRLGREAGLRIHEGTLPGAALPAGRYDVIMMWHVLEHVPSPKATLQAARELLRPKGRLVVVCPLIDSLAARWFGPAWFGMRELPRHLTHFTQETLRRHLEAAGFDVERATPIRRPAFMRRSFGYLANDTRKALYRRLARSRVLARLLSHVARLIGRTDEVLFVARRACEEATRRGV